MSKHYSAALPILFVILRLLVFVNLLIGAALLILLLVMPHAQWIMTSLDLKPGPEAERIILSMRIMAVMMLITIPLNHLILTRLIAIVDTVRQGAPFVRENALRLQLIAWILLALQLLSIVIGAIAYSVSTKAHPVDVDAGFSLSGWLGVLLTFVLARVFAEGSLMREDLDGTV